MIWQIFLSHFFFFHLFAFSPSAGQNLVIERVFSCWRQQQHFIPFIILKPTIKNCLTNYFLMQLMRKSSHGCWSVHVMRSQPLDKSSSCYISWYWEHDTQQQKLFDRFVFWILCRRVKILIWFLSVTVWKRRRNTKVYQQFEIFITSVNRIFHYTSRHWWKLFKPTLPATNQSGHTTWNYHWRAFCLKYRLLHLRKLLIVLPFPLVLIKAAHRCRLTFFFLFLINAMWSIREDFSQN